VAIGPTAICSWRTPATTGFWNSPHGPGINQRPFAYMVNRTSLPPTAGSPASAQTLQLPQGVFVDAAYTLYVADAGNNRVLVFSDTKNTPTSGSSASIVIGQNGFGAIAPGEAASGLRIPLMSRWIAREGVRFR